MMLIQNAFAAQEVVVAYNNYSMTTTTSTYRYARASQSMGEHSIGEQSTAEQGIAERSKAERNSAYQKYQKYEQVNSNDSAESNLI